MPFDEIEQEDLVRRCLAYVAGQREEEENREAWMEAAELADEDLERAWDLTLRLVAAAPSKDALDFIAAYLLETMVFRYDDGMQERTVQAAHDPKFRECLAQVILGKEGDPVIRELVNSAQKEWLTYEPFDNALNEFALRRNLHVCTHHRDDEVRSIDLVSGRGERAQIWLQLYQFGGVQLHAWDYAERRWSSATDSASLPQALEQAYEVIVSWWSPEHGG